MPLAAKQLQAAPKAVDLMLDRLGGALSRELTGRTCSRAWGIVESPVSDSAPLSPYCRRAASYADRLLRGAHPNELPVQAPQISSS